MTASSRREETRSTVENLRSEAFPKWLFLDSRSVIWGDDDDDTRLHGFN
jgi:hypothetical protein